MSLHLKTNAPSRLERDPVNIGLPKLNFDGKPLGRYEFWPSWFFYLPVVVYWIFLSIRYRSFSLPMLANPTIELGGMVGESKSAILDLAVGEAREIILPYVTLRKKATYDDSAVSEILKQARALDICLPCIVKPDLGCRGAGVQKINSPEELLDYLNAFPLGRDFMLQKLAPYQAEVGLFYQRMPNEKQGKITSLTFKYAPYVLGDGQRTLKELIEDDRRAGKLTHVYFPKNEAHLEDIPVKGEYLTLAFAGSHSRGSIFRNGGSFITDALEKRIDALMHQIPGFHYGRMDIKFEDIDSFTEGRHFALIEINGASSESTHIWDSRTTLKEIFSTLLSQYRTLFEMGDQIRRSGVESPKISVMIKTWLRELKATKELPPSN